MLVCIGHPAIGPTSGSFAYLYNSSASDSLQGRRNRRSVSRMPAHSRHCLSLGFGSYPFSTPIDERTSHGKSSHSPQWFNPLSSQHLFTLHSPPQNGFSIFRHPLQYTSSLPSHFSHLIPHLDSYIFLSLPLFLCQVVTLPDHPSDLFFRNRSIQNDRVPVRLI